MLGTKTKKLVWTILLATAIALPVRATVVTAYRAKSDAVSPEVPKGGYVVVNRLDRTWEEGDIVVFRSADGNKFGRVKGMAESGEVEIERRDEDAFELAAKDVIGRAFLIAR